MPYGLPVVGFKILQPYLLEYYRGIEEWSLRKFLNLRATDPVDLPDLRTRKSFPIP